MQTMSLTSTYENAGPTEWKPGATTWYRGERCTVIGTAEMACLMVSVVFGDGREGIFKPGELGLKSGDVAKYLASRAAVRQ